MKIDILQGPPADIFANRTRYLVCFLFFLALACLGLLCGAYAILFDTRYYDILEKCTLGLFAGSSLFIAYFGEKLQAYKKLTPPQEQELAELGQRHIDIETYRQLVMRKGRRLVRAEYEACKLWSEDADRQNEE